MGDQEAKAEDLSSWVLLGKELTHRSLSPLSHSSFVFFFVVGVVGLGGIGVWLELETLSRIGSAPQTPLGSLRTALISFFPALAGTSCMQLIWSDESKKYMKSFSTAMMMGAATVAVMTARPSVSDTSALWIAGIASIVALWTWWIANAFQNEFLDPPDAAVGGDAGAAQLPGDLSDYQS
jgi:hypothetical protein